MPYELPRRGETEVLVSWDGAGTYLGAYDDVTADLQREPAVVVEIGRDQARALGRPRVNMATWRLANQHRRYSGENPGSELRGQLLPGRPTRIQKLLGDDAAMDSADVVIDDPVALMEGLATYRLFTGKSDDPAELYGPGPRKRWVDMRALGSLTMLRGVTITIGLQTDITTGAAMLLVFQAAGLAASEYVLDADAVANGRLLRYWWVDRRDAFEVAQQLWATEGPTAALYEDQEGRANFEGANYLTLTARSQIVQQTFTSSDVSRDTVTMDSAVVLMDDPNYGMDGAVASLTFVGLGVEQGFRQIVNDISVRVDQRAAQATQQVWEYSGPIVLGASEVRTVIARASDPLTSIVTPVLTTDYTIGAGSLISVVATALGALSVAITLTAGGGGATVNPPSGGNGLRLRASPVTVVSTLDVSPTINVAGSQAEYGVRSLPGTIDIWPCLDVSDAAGLADAWILTYSVNRPVVTLRIVNTSGLLLKEILSRRISDLIHVVDPTESGVDLDLTIHSLRHEIRGDQLHALTIGCEKRVEQDWALWDVGRFDVDRFGQ